jgi:hypothetical protein
MTAENERPELPEWAREERQRDLAWIKENMVLFREAAHTAFRQGGRGAIVVDTTSLPVERMVAEYEPEREFVIVLLKPEERTSSYRTRAVEKVQRGRPRER